MVPCRMGEVGVLPGQLPTYIVEPRPFVGRAFAQAGESPGTVAICFAVSKPQTLPSKTGRAPAGEVRTRPAMAATRRMPEIWGRMRLPPSRLARDPGEAGSRELERSGEARAVRGVAVAARDREAVVPARAVRERGIPAHDACGVAAELGDPGLRGRTGPARAERLQVVGELPLLEGRADLGGAGCARRRRGGQARRGHDDERCELHVHWGPPVPAIGEGT